MTSNLIQNIVVNYIDDTQISLDSCDLDDLVAQVRSVGAKLWDIYSSHGFKVNPKPGKSSVLFAKKAANFCPC